MKRLLLTVTTLCITIAISKAESEMISNVKRLYKMLDDVGETIIGQIDRVKIPIINVNQLGYCIHNHPFTNAEKVALKPFHQYMSIIYVTQDEIKNWLSTFSSAYLEYVPAYRLTDGERRAAVNLVNEATQKVEISFNAVTAMFKRSEIKNKIDEMEHKKMQLIGIMNDLMESLQNASDGDLESREVMRESVKEIEEVSKKLVVLSESFEMLPIMDELAQYIIEIAEAMKDLPLNLNMAYLL